MAGRRGRMRGGFCFGDGDVGLVACVAGHGLGGVAFRKVRVMAGIISPILRVGRRIRRGGSSS